MTEPKPGYQTTEFWIAFLSHISAIATLINPHIVTGPWVQPFAIGAAAIATGFYTHSRGTVKAATAQVQVAQIQAAIAPRPAPSDAASFIQHVKDTMELIPPEPKPPAP